MDQMERRKEIVVRLRRAWNNALRTAELISVSPLEDLSDRVLRLEREIAEMKRRRESGIVPLQ